MNIFLIILVGILTGFSSGMFGIGGALISTPLLRELVGLSELMALATPLPATLPAALSGSFVYARERLLRLDVARMVLITGIPLNIAGAALVKFMPGSLMMVLTGLMLLYSAVIFLQRSFQHARKKKTGVGEPEENGGEPELFGKGVLLITGAIAGFLSGFLAIGGGIVLVPAFVKVLRLPTKQALATSLVCVAVLSIPGVTVHALNGFIDWRVAGILSLTVFPLSALGARTATRLRSGMLELIYGVVMLLFALFFIAKNISP